MSERSLPVAWITGAGGLIGSWIAKLAPTHAPGWAIRALTREELDLTDYSAAEQRFQRERPELVIHCAAMSQSPACQANPPLARKINVEVTERLATLAEKIPFVYFSSDLIFDGRSGNYREGDDPNPLSVYGETKVAAEQHVQAHSKHLILRASLNGGASPTGDRSFNEQLRRGWQAGQPTKLFTDEFRSPIPASVTAQAVWELVTKQASGTFHLGGAERLSRWQIGQLVAVRWPQLSPQLIPGSLNEYQGAPRPRDASLDCSKVQKLLSFPLPGLGQWLEEHPEAEF